MQRTDQQARHDLVAHAQHQRAVEHVVRQGDRGGHRDHVARIQAQLHARRALRDAVAHGRHAAGDLGRGAEPARLGLDQVRVVLQRRVGRQHVVVGGDDADVGRTLRDHRNAGLRAGKAAALSPSGMAASACATLAQPMRSAPGGRLAVASSALQIGSRGSRRCARGCAGSRRRPWHEVSLVSWFSCNLVTSAMRNRQWRPETVSGLPIGYQIAAQSRNHRTRCQARPGHCAGMPMLVHRATVAAVSRNPLIPPPFVLPVPVRDPAPMLARAKAQWGGKATCGCSPTPR